MANKTQKNRASIWKKRFEQRQQKLAPLFEEAQKHYDIMYAVQQTKKVSPWKSKVFVPVLASKAWDLIARMSDVVPLFNVTVKNEIEMNDETGAFELPEASLQRQHRIEAKLQQEYKCGDQPMKLRVFDPLVDAVVAGTGYAYVPWVLETKVQKARPELEDGSLDNESTIVKKTQTGHNDFRGINFFNVFPADGPSFFEIPYLIVRGKKPLVDMKKSGIYDPAKLELCDTTGKQDELEEYNYARNRVVNEQDHIDIDDSVDIVTYYECYERTEKGIQLTTYAEGQAQGTDPAPWIEIRKPSYPYWHDMFPVVPFYLRKKSYSVFGESLFENNRTLQSATNDLFNHYLDNWNLSIESMLMYEDGSLTSDFIVEPGGEITYTGEPPKQFKFPEPNPQQLSLVMNVLEKGIDSATFSPYASGNPSDSNDKTQGTAYGVKTIAEAATTKIGFFRDNFKQSMRVVGKIWLSNLQQFADDPEEITRVQDGREVPDIVVPSDYQGELELDIDDDSMVPMSKVEKREMHKMFLEDIAMTQKLAMTQAEIFKTIPDIPRYNFHEINEDTAQLYSKKDFNRYVLDSKVEIPQEQPVDNTKELLNFNYKDAPADIKAQIESMYGLQPSAMHDSTLTHEAIKMGAEEGQITGDPMYGQQRPGANQAPAAA